MFWKTTTLSESLSKNKILLLQLNFNDNNVKFNKNIPQYILNFNTTINCTHRTKYFLDCDKHIISI